MSFMVNPFVLFPAAGGDPNFANVVALLHFDGTNNSTTITDSSSLANTWTTSGSFAIDTTFAKFGVSSSDNTSGSNGYCQATDATNFNLGTGDFTIEFFIRIKASGEPNPTYFDTRFGAYTHEIVLYDSNGSAGQANVTFFAAGANRITSSNLSRSVWYFVQVIRSSGTTTLYLDGVSQGTYSDSNTYNVSQYRIGNNSTNNAAQCPVNFDEFRVTKGVARPSTVPTAAFPNS